MDLQALAEKDLAVTLESDGRELTLIDPSGRRRNFKAIANDISLLIDPETGVPVSGRNANASIRINSLRAAGFALPHGEEDESKVPWVVEYATVTGDTIRTKVISSNPDRSIGLITLRLELIQ